MQEVQTDKQRKAEVRGKESSPGKLDDGRASPVQPGTQQLREPSLRHSRLEGLSGASLAEPTGKASRGGGYANAPRELGQLGICGEQKAPA